MIESSPIRSAVRLAGLGAVIAALAPLQAVAMRIAPTRWSRLPRRFHRECVRVLGVTVERRGEISTARPTLFVSNHVSYLDIPVLGSLAEFSFIARGDIAGWPVAGTLARMQRTVFIDRRRHAVTAERSEVEKRLADGDSLMLFPESTTGSGTHLLPFKSALLSVAHPSDPARAPTVQPVSIAYTALDGMPITRNLRPLVAWYGAMAAGEHFWRLVGLGRLRAVVEFHPAVEPGRFASRKALTRHCERTIASALAHAIAGRPHGIAKPSQ
ncbi:MAG: 1-acyl-sn-glycerol-3-phosphate acyltransferase [Alphaproteobacteria bacterium]|nr:1-acyl-sn-glycerol-3-phosphate acyltransferase [Alphaproteobacteria bacterium]